MAVFAEQDIYSADCVLIELRSFQNGMDCNSYEFIYGLFLQ